MTGACRSCSGAGAWPPADRAEAIETVDIMPTLAASIGLAVDPGSIDGECLTAVQGIVLPTR